MIPLKVRLTKCLAELINGVNLSRIHVGDVVEMSPRDAGVLLAEGWALPAEDEKSKGGKVVEMPTPPAHADAADRPPRVRRKRRPRPLWPPRERSG